MTKRFILLAALAATLLAAVPAAASAHISSIVTAPGRDFLATDQPVALRMRIVWNRLDLTAFAYQAYVWPSGNGPTLELVPMTQDPSAPAQLSGTVSATEPVRWAAKPGTYWIGVLATPTATPTPAPCPPLPRRPIAATTARACPQSVSALLAKDGFEGIPRSKVTVHAPLTLMWARFVARQKAERIGWRSKAPLTCVAPFAPSAYSCTFRWHVGRARRLVERAVTVAQDTTTGLVTVTRA